MFFAFKPLRVILQISAFFLIVFATEPGTPMLIDCTDPGTTQAISNTVENKDSANTMLCRNVFFTFFIVVLAPLVFFVVLLDIIMCSVQLSGQQGERRNSYWIAITINSIAVIGLLAAWLPYYAS